ncbi:MAG: dephospho-CoA kinase [Acidobacteria bacterium]|nr:dephospho-CoA kinase [Acidobacteriota bacterium]
MILEVALTGGLATGKGFVGEVFERLGCYRIEADKLGHRALELHRDEVAALFGSADRKAIAAQAFADPAKLEKLNAIVHPAVEALRRERIEAIRQETDQAIVICEAAIYIETGAWRRFHEVVLTVCGQERQIERAMARSGWTREETEARLARQWPDETKRKHATYVIDTSVSFAETERQTVEVYNRLRER